jgi:heat shock protein HslJ
MMDEFETNLATALRSAAPTPPTEIDPASITRAARHGRARTLGAPLVAALMVAAVAVIVLALAHTGGGRSPAIGSQQPSDLFGSWKLIDLQGFDGTAHTEPDAAFALSFSPTGFIGIGRAGCLSTHVNVRAGTVEIGHWSSRLLAGCPHLGERQGHFLFDQILSGTTTWEIRDDQLTLSKDGAAAVFQRSNAPGWARVCIPPRLGRVTHNFDGLTVPAAQARARQEGAVMHFMAADGSCDIGSIPITAGHIYVHAALAGGRVVFARIS